MKDLLNFFMSSYEQYNLPDFVKEEFEDLRELKFYKNFPKDELYFKIENIMEEEWDPVGVKSLGVSDEYRDYVITIHELIKEGANLEKLTEEMLDIHHFYFGPGYDIEYRGLTDWKVRCIRTAIRLFNECK